MSAGSNASRAVSLFAMVAGISACDGLVAGSAVTPRAMGSGGTAGTPDPRAGTGGTTVSPVPIDASTGDAVVETSATPGTGGRVVSGNDGGPAVDSGDNNGPSTMTPCGLYPDGPALVRTRFQMDTVVPNLSFTREDGSTVTFGDLRCNKKNRLLYWAVGGDLCPPCVDTAAMMEVPAWKELGPKGLLIVESFNGSGDLLSSSPWKGWRQKVTGWPAKDDDTMLLVAEPKTKPYYALSRIVGGIPFSVVIDLETMKVVNMETRSVATVRARLMATPPRP